MSTLPKGRIKGSRNKATLDRLNRIDTAGKEKLIERYAKIARGMPVPLIDDTNICLCAECGKPPWRDKDGNPTMLVPTPGLQTEAFKLVKDHLYSRLQPLNPDDGSADQKLTVVIRKMAADEGEPK